MSDSTVRVSKQASKKLGHIAIETEMNKKELLGLVAENLDYDQNNQEIKLEADV